MVRTRRDQANNARLSILLSSLPPQLRYLSGQENWKPIKDEIRRVAYMHGLADIHEEAFDVVVCVGHGNLFAICRLTHRDDDAREIFRLIRGHVFEGCALQAWLFEPGQNGPRFLDGPKDRVGGGVLLPFPPTSLNLSICQSRTSRGPTRPPANQAERPTHNTVINRPGRDPNVSHDHVFPQLLPAASTSMQDASNNDAAVVVPHTSPYTTNLDAYQKPLEFFSPFVGDASKLSDMSRMLHNTPVFSSSSRTSSVSAIPDAYSPARSSSYSTFQNTPSSPYANHNSSISSSSSLYTPSSSLEQSGSLHTFQHTASDEVYKVIINNVKAGVTHKQLSVLLDQKMPRHSYCTHETPKQCGFNKWSVEFAKEEDAEKAKERLHHLDFEGQKLKVHMSNGAPRRQLSSGGSATSATSSSMTSGPTIV